MVYWRDDNDNWEPLTRKESVYVYTVMLAGVVAWVGLTLWLLL